MRKKARKIWWIVSGQGRQGRYFARNAGAAVAQFRRAFRLTLQTDPENGNWKGISYAPA